jgi:hypothetical protein
MAIVYIVMDRVENSGNTFGPYVEEIFDSKKKAIEYINRIWSDCIISYNPSTNEYCRVVSEHTKAFRYIEEREVQ